MPSESSPTNSARPSPWSRLPLGVLGMLALVVVVESFVMSHDHDLTTLIAANWEIEGRSPARYAKDSQILCFGDSMVKFGVQPRVLSKTLGMSSYNFALYCGPPQASYFLLKRAFEAGARPSAVIVDFQPEFLRGDSLKILSRTFPELLTFPETLDLCWNARDTDRLGEFLVAKILPSVRKRYEIQASILAAIHGESTSIKDKVLAAKRNWKLNRGAEALAKNPYYHGEVPTTGAYPAMFWTPWYSTDLNTLYLERFLKLAASKKVPVFWVLQPNTNAVDVQREQVGYNAQYEKFIRKYQAQFPNLVVIDGRHIAYPHHVFIDPVHLDRQGATAYTLGIAEVLKNRLGTDALKTGPSWVALPDHRTRLDAVALEDTLESQNAMQAERAKRLR